MTCFLNLNASAKCVGVKVLKGVVQGLIWSKLLENLTRVVKTTFFLTATSTNEWRSENQLEVHKHYNGRLQLNLSCNHLDL